MSDNEKRDFFNRLYATVGSEHGEYGMDLQLLAARYKGDWFESLQQAIERFGYSSIVEIIEMECDDLIVYGNHKNAKIFPKTKNEDKIQMNLLNALEIEKKNRGRNRGNRYRGNQGRGRYNAQRNNLYMNEPPVYFFNPPTPSRPRQDHPQFNTSHLQQGCRNLPNSYRQRIDVQAAQRFIHPHIRQSPSASRNLNAADYPRILPTHNPIGHLRVPDKMRQRLSPATISDWPLPDYNNNNTFMQQARDLKIRNSMNYNEWNEMYPAKENAPDIQKFSDSNPKTSGRQLNFKYTDTIKVPTTETSSIPKQFCLYDEDDDDWVNAHFSVILEEINDEDGAEKIIISKEPNNCFEIDDEALEAFQRLDISDDDQTDKQFK